MRYKIPFAILTMMLSCFLFYGCLKPAIVLTNQDKLNAQLGAVDKTKLADDLKIIDDSLQKKSITPLIEPNGVRYTIQTLGTGPKPTLDNTITFKYKGYFLSTKAVFDQNSTGLQYPLYGLILGWQTTFPLLPKGTKATLYIPSGLGYGAQDVKDNAGKIIIPANSNLVFEVELVDVQ